MVGDIGLNTGPNTTPNTTPKRSTRPEAMDYTSPDTALSPVFTPPKVKKTRTLSDNFRLGDKVYGLSEEREKYFTSDFKKKFHRDGKDPTVDAMNNHLLGNEKVRRLSQEATLFNQFLTTESPYRKKINSCNSDKFKRRSCKAALFNPVFRTIHFVLDGIDDSRVLTKRVQNARGEYVKDDSFTSSELRCIARHWEELNGRVKFYRDGYEVTEVPHWITNKEVREDLIGLYVSLQQQTVEAQHLANERAGRLDFDEGDFPLFEMGAFTLELSPTQNRYNLFARDFDRDSKRTGNQPKDNSTPFDLEDDAPFRSRKRARLDTVTL